MGRPTSREGHRYGFGSRDIARTVPGKTRTPSSTSPNPTCQPASQGVTEPTGTGCEFGCWSSVQEEHQTSKYLDRVLGSVICKVLFTCSSTRLLNTGSRLIHRGCMFNRGFRLSSCPATHCLLHCLNDLLRAPSEPGFTYSNPQSTSTCRSTGPTDSCNLHVKTRR
jgi:hypothetical protein